MKTISFVIPVYNEEVRLEKTFRALKSLNLPCGLKLEKVIFVDDGSTDSTLKNLYLYKDILRKKLKSEIKIISYRHNSGKGHAITAGMKKSRSDYSLFFDADMSTGLDELKKFMPAIRRNIPIIIGTRKNGHSTVIRHQPVLREKLGKVFTYLSNFILNTWVTDFTCGFKAFSRQAKDILFPALKVKSWGFDAELLFLGRISGFEYLEVPVIWTDDRASKVRLLKDGPHSLFNLIYVRLMSFLNMYDMGIVVKKPNQAFSFFKVLKSYLF